MQELLVKELQEEQLLRDITGVQVMQLQLLKLLSIRPVWG